MECRLKLDVGWQHLLWTIFGRAADTRSSSVANASLVRIGEEKRCVNALSVRTLFDGILTLLPGKRGDTIIMSAINIRDMFEIAQSHGYNVQVVDVDPRTLLPPPGALLRAHLESEAKICVISHLFGAISSLEDAAELHRRGVFIIEDMAQSFCKQRQIGDQSADCTLLSFGPIKRYSALGGAIGLFRDKNIASGIADLLHSYPQSSDAWFRKRGLKYIGLKAMSLPLPYAVLLKALRMFGRDIDGSIGGLARGFANQELHHAIRYQPPTRMLQLMTKRLVADSDEETRQAVCQSVVAALHPEMVKIGQKAEGHGYWLFPITTKQPERTIKLLRSKGFDATSGATSLCVGDKHAAPNAVRLLEECVYVPNPADMTAGKRKRMIAALQSLASVHN
ncbi:MAG: aminotransferase class V-fold PLP-dependent enzyme [Pseudomonadota bacterium]